VTGSYLGTWEKAEWVEIKEGMGEELGVCPITCLFVNLLGALERGRSLRQREKWQMSRSL
jgi:hypothetical protein